MKKALATTLTLGSYLTLAQAASAESINAVAQNAGGGNFNLLSKFTLDGPFISAVITMLFIIAIIIALIYLIWGGIKWIMSGGDKSALQAAREHVIAAIVGLVVIFLAYFIVNFVLGVFGLNQNFNFTLPTFQ